MSTDTPRPERVTLSNEEHASLVDALSAPASLDPGDWADQIQNAVEQIVTDRLAAREQALREEIAGQIRAVEADPDRRRPLALNAEVPTDFANDFEWAAIIARGGAR